MRQVAHRVVLLAKRASSVLRRGIVRWFPYVPGKIAEVILQGFIDLAPVPDIALVEIPFPDQPGSKLRHVDERFDFLNASRAPLPLIALNLGSPTVVSRPPVQCQRTQPPQYAAARSSRFLKRPLLVRIGRGIGRFVQKQNGNSPGLCTASSSGVFRDSRCRYKQFVSVSFSNAVGHRDGRRS